MVRVGNAGERGAAAVEFAIVLPLLCAILFGIVEFSLVMYNKAQITAASRNGARFGTMWSPGSRPSCDVIRAASGPVRSYERGMITFGGSNAITTTCPGAANNTNPICTQDGHETLTVRAEFTYRLLLDPTRFLSFYTGTSSNWTALLLRSETIMRCE